MRGSFCELADKQSATECQSVLKSFVVVCFTEFRSCCRRYLPHAHVPLSSHSLSFCIHSTRIKPRRFPCGFTKSVSSSKVCVEPNEKNDRHSSERDQNILGTYFFKVGGDAVPRVRYRLVAPVSAVLQT